MRALLLASCAAVACEATPAEPARRLPPLDPAAEQAAFDGERHPERVVAALGLLPGQRVADVGAGTGLLTGHLARAVGPSGQVVATDIDGHVLELMSQRLARYQLDNVEPRLVAADRAGLEADHYDAILLAQVDHYFADRVAWLRDAAPALHRGGRLVIANRIHHRHEALAAAASAGFRLRSELTDVPGQFIAVFTLEPAP